MDDWISRQIEFYFGSLYVFASIPLAKCPNLMCEKAKIRKLNDIRRSEWKIFISFDCHNSVCHTNTYTNSERDSHANACIKWRRAADNRWHWIFQITNLIRQKSRCRTFSSVCILLPNTTYVCDLFVVFLTVSRATCEGYVKWLLTSAVNVCAVYELSNDVTASIHILLPMLSIHLSHAHDNIFGPKIARINIWPHTIFIQRNILRTISHRYIYKSDCGEYLMPKNCDIMNPMQNGVGQQQ